MLNPPFVHGIQLVATAKKEHAIAAALGDGRLYWYYPNAPKPSKAADPVAYWVDNAHAAAISCLATSTGVHFRRQNTNDLLYRHAPMHVEKSVAFIPATR